MKATVEEDVREIEQELENTSEEELLEQYRQAVIYYTSKIKSKKITVDKKNRWGQIFDKLIQTYAILDKMVENKESDEPVDITDVDIHINIKDGEFDDNGDQKIKMEAKNDQTRKYVKKIFEDSDLKLKRRDND